MGEQPGRVPGLGNPLGAWLVLVSIHDRCRVTISLNAMVFLVHLAPELSAMLRLIKFFE